MQDWGRLITAMATPLTGEGKLCISKARALARKLEEQGITALVAAGTTGESPTLTDEEKLELFAAVKEAVKIPVIANVGSNNTEMSARFAQKAKLTGVDGVMAVVPYYNKPNRQGLILHFQAIAQAAGLPLMVYNVPGRTGMNLDGDTILTLAEIPYVCSIKEATDDIAKITRIIRDAPRGFLIYTGEDLMTLPLLAIGAYGVVSVAAHVVGRQMKDMIDLFLAGKVTEAQKHHQSLLNIYQSLFLTSNPIPLKAALKLTGFDAGPLRLPLVEAEEDLITRLAGDLRDLSLLGGA